MLEVTGLTKRYGSHYAIQDVSFQAKQGDILGFLGQNGAGKSTTMNIITGYLSASSGSVSINGLSISKSPAEYKRLIGYLPEIPPLYTEMTVLEYLRFVCEIKEISRRRIRSHVDEICEMLDLQNHQKRLIRNLSKGYRQRVGMAQALIGDPEIIILDEPTAGLDPRQMIEIRNLISWLGERHTVILSSHVLSEVADVCNRALIIHQGHVVARDSMTHLIDGGHRQLILRTGGTPEETYAALSGTDGLAALSPLSPVEEDACDWRIEMSANTDIRREISARLARSGIPILMLRPAESNLEDIFLRLTEETEVNDR